MTRTIVPSPAVLSLTGPRAAEDLAHLGWDNEESVDLLWALAGSGDADLALNTLTRIVSALGNDHAELDDALRRDAGLRVRLFALLGGSTALGDHLAANPHLWQELARGLPTPEELMQAMLGAVDAVPAEFDVAEEPEGVTDTATTDLTTPGTYRARIAEPQAATALRLTVHHRDRPAHRLS